MDLAVSLLSPRDLSQNHYVLVQLLPNAVVVVLGVEQLPPSEVVALNSAGRSSVVLNTVCGCPEGSNGSHENLRTWFHLFLLICCCARDLPEKNVPSLGGGGTAVGDGQGDGVRRCCSKLRVH